MDWQQALSLAIVLCTAGLLLRGWLNRRRRPHAACGGSCACPGAKGSPKLL